MKSRNEPDGIIWHDDEQPTAAYPTEYQTCEDCGRSTKWEYCDSCFGERMRQVGVRRERDMRRFYEQERLKQEREERERKSYYGGWR